MSMAGRLRRLAVQTRLRPREMQVKRCLHYPHHVYLPGIPSCEIFNFNASRLIF